MADKRLLYFSATRAVLYRWAHGRLAVESSFANNEDGAQAFAAHFRGTPAGLFYVLVDIVEEDFHQETIPFVRGADRRTLVGRKLAQRYRDTSLSLALSLGFEKTQRRDERPAPQLVHEQRAVPALAPRAARQGGGGRGRLLRRADRAAARGRGSGRRRRRCCSSRCSRPACARASSRAAGSGSAASGRWTPPTPPIRTGWRKRSTARRRASTST